MNNEFKFDRFSFWVDEAYLKSTLFIAVSGSHAYGWNTEKSDLDIRHVVFPDIKQALSIFHRMRTQQSIRPDGVDITEYPIQDFLKLLASGNGNVMDNLFENHLFSDEKKVKEIREIVLENLHLGFLQHHLGYYHSLKKDIKIPNRIKRYGLTKLFLMSYKELMEGIILGEESKVVFNIPEQMKVMKDHDLMVEEILITYKNNESLESNFDIPSITVELSNLEERLKKIIELGEPFPSKKFSYLSIHLEKWYISQYVK